jgi:cation diffusion facilitator family transporter
MSTTATDADRAERRSLVASAAGNVVIACVGVTIALISDSQAILLDGLFNAIYFGTALFTLRVATLVRRGDDARFPYGYGFFEPLVNGLKGFLILGVSLLALVGSVEALFAGGRLIRPGLAVAYGVFAMAAGFLLMAITKRGAKKSGSPLVKADADGWTVNAAVSACVLLAFATIFLIEDTSLDWLAPYVDPTVVLGVVLLSIGIPVRMAWKALMGLLNRTPSRELVDGISGVVEKGLADLPLRACFVRVIQPGRLRMVTAHVVLPEDFGVERLKALDEVRAKVQDRLREDHADTILDIFFTTDLEWGKPAAD